MITLLITILSNFDSLIFCCFQTSKRVRPHWTQDTLLIECELGSHLELEWHDLIAIDFCSIESLLMALVRKLARLNLVFTQSRVLNPLMTNPCIMMYLKAIWWKKIKQIELSIQNLVFFSSHCEYGCMCSKLFQQKNYLYIEKESFLLAQLTLVFMIHS